MGRRLNEVSRTILTSIRELGEVAHELSKSPVLNQYRLARWLWEQTRPKGTPYDTRYRRAVWRLRRAGLIRLQHNMIELAPEAIEQLNTAEHDIETIRIDQSAHWDGLWRMVIWDVPERKRDLRNRLRQKLTELGFVRIQGSIWVSPWPCEHEITLLRDAYGLSQESVLYVEAKRIEGESRLRAHFRLDQEDGHPEAVETPPLLLTEADARLVEQTLNQV